MNLCIYFLKFLFFLLSGFTWIGSLFLFSQSYFIINNIKLFPLFGLFDVNEVFTISITLFCMTCMIMTTYLLSSICIRIELRDEMQIEMQRDEIRRDEIRRGEAGGY